jgi:hypothetical protein
VKAENNASVTEIEDMSPGSLQNWAHKILPIIVWL